MKRIIACALSLIMILGVFAGCGESKKTNADGAVEISTADEFFAIANDPNADYVIVSEIDLGGKEWKPIDNFGGTLSGVWGGIFNHTVKNFTIKGKKSDKAVGFAKKISGTVECLNIKDVKVELEKGFSGSAGVLGGVMENAPDTVRIENATVSGTVSNAKVGILAGEIKGEVRNCFSEGKVSVTSNGETFIGGIAGKVENVTDTESRAQITANSDKTLTLGGIAGNANNLDTVYFGGTINATAKSGVLSASQFGGSVKSVVDGYANATEFNVTGDGELKYGDFSAPDDNDKVSECVKRDLSNIESVVLTKEQYEIRKTAVDKMYIETTYPWMPSKDMLYTDSCMKDGKPRHTQEYKKGEWYFGLPYTHMCGSLEKMQANLDKNGAVKESIKKTGWGRIIGNDCADCVFWALQTVSASPKYVLTDGMICENGMEMLGEYEIKTDEKGRRSTKEICLATDEQKMYENYALLLLGDVIVKGPGGHTRMAAESACVYRNEDGTINGVKSYVVTHEQGGGVSDLQERHSACKTAKKYTFEKLYSDCYVTVTIPEYKTGVKTPVELSCDFEGTTVSALKRASVTSNYRINFVTVVAKSGDKVVAEKSVFPANGSHNVTYSLGGIITPEFTQKLEDGKEYQVTVFVNQQDDEHIAISKKLKK